MQCNLICFRNSSASLALAWACFNWAAWSRSRVQRKMSSARLRIRMPPIRIFIN